MGGAMIATFTTCAEGNQLRGQFEKSKPHSSIVTETNRRCFPGLLDRTKVSSRAEDAAFGLTCPQPWQMADWQGIAVHGATPIVVGKDSESRGFGDSSSHVSSPHEWKTLSRDGFQF